MKDVQPILKGKDFKNEEIRIQSQTKRTKSNCQIDLHRLVIWREAAPLYPDVSKPQN